ncbi:PREDICTED: F-box/kelch-repeat protein At3g27150-like [Camelina sativa]|uniref:F-box/kelch-repeat protein At3g27150-like n=1 Tax=Camelina sativa TaxID=90675 RepID=A0ABM0V6P8_CAMSA|nr:PREDICTED: F-box/kelch-repeat protein At3g27150-like [Camelina sativa]XP_010451743.1 PREDICTED: F-box/kelch-repeat protein At3g27150-like [Camelina sativa]
MSILSLGKERISRLRASLSQSPARRLLIVDSELGERKGEIIQKFQKHTSLKPQDDELSDVSQVLYKLEVEIFVGVLCSTYWKTQGLNSQFLQLLKRYDVFKMRRECGIVEPYVFMLTSGEACWTMFDKNFENFETLPRIPSDVCFYLSDKETVCAGTHLMVIGRELGGMAVWRYELGMHEWVKGPSMITPRCMYASASCGFDAYFAGGLKVNGNRYPEVLRSVEKYNAQTKTWSTIPEMHKRRKFSSGCFLRGKFYVIGGRNEYNEYLTCGERYDEVTNSWTLVPDMLGSMTFMPSQSPPLIAVANNNLYSLEAYSNELRVYDVNANSWKILGVAPVISNAGLGWGVAFKSIGDRLLLIGNSSPHSSCAKMRAFTCRRPSPDVEELVWEELNTNYGNVQFDHFIRNCCVMFA